MKDCFLFKLAGEISANVAFFDAVKIGVVDTSLANSMLQVRKVAGTDLIVAVPVGKTITSDSQLELESDENYNYYKILSDGVTIINIDKSSLYDFYLIGASNLEILNIVGGPTAIRFKDITALRGNDYLTGGFGNNTTNVTGIVGSVLDFASLSLSAVNLGNNQVGGSFEELLQTIWEKGKRSGTITLNNAGGVIKLNNQSTPYNASYTATYSSTGISLQTGQTTVATFDGTSWSY